MIWALVDHASHASSNEEAQQLAQALFALNRWGNGFEEALLATLVAPANPDAGGPVAGETGWAPADGAEGLALVDLDAYERTLETKRLAASLSDGLASEIGTLAACLGESGNAGATTALDELPFSPSRIAQALTSQTVAMAIGPLARRVAFASAKAILAQELRTLYRELLETSGIEPGSRLPRVREPRAQRPGIGGTSSLAHTGDGNNAGQDGGAAAAPPTAGGGRVAATDGVLTSLWTKLPTPGTTLSRTELVAALEHAARSDGIGQGLERDARQRTELAADLWDLIQEDDHRLASADGWRQRLQLPLLAAATTDPEFFTRPDHPVRVILDRMEELGRLIQTAEDAALVRSVQDTVEHLLAQLEGPAVLDRRQLERLAGAIEELADSQSERYQRNVDRVIKACAGRDRLRQCRDRVQAELDGRYRGKSLPPVFAEFMATGWQTLLEIHLLRDGVDGAEYREHLAMLDALMQSLGGEPHHRMGQLPKQDMLLERVAAGLAFGSVEPLKRTALVEKLSRLLAEARSGTCPLVLYRPTASAEPAAASAPEAADEQEWQLALERAKAVKPGDMVIVSGAPEGRKRLKLAWVGDGGWLYTLVDERGFKAAELTPDQLARKLVSRQIELQPAQERSLSERAIDQMLESLGERVVQQGHSDALTGLHSPSRFQTLLTRVLADAQQGVPQALCWIDVDQFTLLRNTLGLEAADQLRLTLSGLLKQRFAGRGILAHLGGDQFAVALTRCERECALEQANAFRQEVAALPFLWEGSRVPVSVSVGLIDLAEINASCAEVFQAADATLFAAKQEGGNRCLLYSGSDGVIHQRKRAMEWLKRVDEALARGSLDLRCQRIAPIDPSSGLEQHYEVLLGVRGKDGEPLDIYQFITAAESYNRMWAVDRWVARAVFEWAAEHLRGLEEIGGLAINLSGQSMNDEGIIDFLRELIRETGVPAARISFEATETVAITNLSRASRIIHAIKGMGCAFALDDFGSGFSSYSYLRQLPVDSLKIDGAFVRGIHKDEADYGVVTSIHEIGHFMGKHTIAEYVEDAEILAKLREIGVDYAQGYGIERPRRLAELA
jgi:diguanylate cyclase (GGDEF)-like protein